MLVFLWAGLFSAGAAPQPWPKPLNYVSDFADVIPARQEESLNALARRLQEKTSSQLEVVTIPSLGDRGFGSIEEAAVSLFEQWGIGQKGKDNGLLILVALKEREWRVEVGYGLEGAVPDAVASRLGRTLLPNAFRQGRYGEGLLNLCTALTAEIAREYNVPLSELNVKSTGGQGPDNAKESQPEGGFFQTLFSLFFTLLVIYFFIRHPNLFLLYMLMGGGNRRDDHWRGGSHFGGGFGGDGGFGGFGGGGGFGGFGGGLSGGGGASGRW
ncbi:MAG TPA: TPM domain-containing protein [bacterium]|nr:TPM domain-containing protein [bacterium]